MRTKIGIGLMALAVPYAIIGLLRDWASLSMGTTALILSGGIMLARGRRAPPQEPDGPSAIPKAPRAPSIPPMPAPDGPTAPATPPERTDVVRREGDVILPPPPAGPRKLTLVHSQGGPVDVGDYRRRVAGKK